MNVTDLHMLRLVEQRSFCTFVLLSQGCKAVLDWLRLFDTTSFYVTLITKTIIDIGSIAFIIIVILVYIGCAMHMLQYNSSYGDENIVIDSVFGNFFFDSILNQYLLMLGEFQTDGF